MSEIEKIEYDSLLPLQKRIALFMRDLAEELKVSAEKAKSTGEMDCTATLYDPSTAATAPAHLPLCMPIFLSIFIFKMCLFMLFRAL